MGMVGAGYGKVTWCKNEKRLLWDNATLVTAQAVSHWITGDQVITGNLWLPNQANAWLGIVDDIVFLNGM